MSKVPVVIDSDAEMMTLTPLGGGQEVGRSCHLLKYKGRTILLDCGIHPGREGIDACPFFDSLSPEDVDIILITHFHLDHCASLPYFTEKTNFKGKIYMTHATKAVMRLLVSDYIKLFGSSRSNQSLYDDQDLQRCIEKIEVIDFHQSIEFKGIRFCAYYAGHVLGAAMFTIYIDGVVVLYTGDYSMEEDRHLSQAEIPSERPDVLIVESTYGVQNHSSREEREFRFTNTVDKTVRRGGSCLIPVFALGRAQELLLILDEYWQSHPEIQEIPIFYASKLASKALRVYQTFVNMMNLHIQNLTNVGNPFKFQFIKNMQTDIDTLGPCVVIASPGMLQNGVSRQLFERWCEDSHNSVVLAGYSVEGTLAKKLLQEPEEIVCLDGRIKKRNCEIEYISFSAHVDYIRNSKFIKTVIPDNIILVHGEKYEMSRLKEELDREINHSWPNAHKPSVVMPKNGQPVTMKFNKAIHAEAVGKTAIEFLSNLDDSGPVVDVPPSSVCISENFLTKVVSVDEMSNYTSCRLGRIRQKQHIPIPISFGLDTTYGSTLHILLPYLSQVFDEVEILPSSKSIQSPDQDDDDDEDMENENTIELFIQSLVTVSESSVGSIVIDWIASPTADMIADCVVSLIQQTLSASSMVISRLSRLGYGTSSSSPLRIKKKKKRSATSTIGSMTSTTWHSRDDLKEAFADGTNSSSDSNSNSSNNSNNIDKSTTVIKVETTEDSHSSSAMEIDKKSQPTNIDTVTGGKGNMSNAYPLRTAVEVEVEVEEEEQSSDEEEEIVKKMRLGLIDPSKDMRKHLPSHNEDDGGKQGGGCGAIATLSGKDILRRNTEKLRKVQQAILAYNLFSEVLLDASGTRLIFRDYPSSDSGIPTSTILVKEEEEEEVAERGELASHKQEPQNIIDSDKNEFLDGNDNDHGLPLPTLLEAYVYIHWGDIAATIGENHAVVQAKEEYFRSKVKSALQNVLLKF